jgi:hypothetical protein
VILPPAGPPLTPPGDIAWRQANIKATMDSRKTATCGNGQYRGVIHADFQGNSITHACVEIGGSPSVPCGERRVRNVEVRGSIPLCSTK